MSQIPKAGIIIIRTGTTELEVLLIFRAKKSDWSFPKGHCEPGESFEQTALREVREETGLEVRVLRSLPDLEYKNAKGEDVLLRMYLGTPQEDSPQERPEKTGDRVEWVPISRVESVLSYQNLKEYFAAIKGVVEFA